MAVPAIAAWSLSAGVFTAADVTVANTSTAAVIAGAIAIVVVALIGAAVQLYLNRKRNKEDDPKFSLQAWKAVIETNQADMQGDIREIRETLKEILQHVRPWPEEGHR